MFPNFKLTMLAVCFLPLAEAPAFAAISSVPVSAEETTTLDGDDADQFIATLEAGGVEKDAEHPRDDGGITFRISRIGCRYTFQPEGREAPSTSCNVLYSDRMGEDGRHYKTLDLEPAAAQIIYATLKNLFGARRLGPELVTGAQDIECNKPAEGATSCQLGRLQQPRRSAGLQP